MDYLNEAPITLVSNDGGNEHGFATEITINGEQFADHIFHLLYNRQVVPHLPRLIYRLRGELLLTLNDDTTQAEAYFRLAIEEAQRQQTGSWELRAAMSLARLWRRQGRSDEACEMLSAIYGWFTEGFETRDLQDARRLLAGSPSPSPDLGGGPGRGLFPPMSYLTVTATSKVSAGSWSFSHGR